MKTKILIPIILLFSQLSLSIAQSQLKLTLKWEKQDKKNMVACIVKNTSNESTILIKESEYEPLTIISPDGTRTFLDPFTNCRPKPANIVLLPKKQIKVFYEPDIFFGNTFTTKKSKENGAYQILWEVKGTQSNTLTYQYISPFSSNATLINNVDITWVAETETLFHFSSNGYERRVKGYNYLKKGSKTIISPFQTIKSDFSDLPIELSSRIMEYELGRLIQNKNIQFIDLEGKKMSWESVQELVIIDEGEIKLNRENPREHFKYESGAFTSMKPSFLVRQIWYYNQKKKKLSTEVIAISPVIPFPIILNDGCGNYGDPYYEPEAYARFGWIKLPQTSTFNFNINRKALIWSRLSTHKYDFQNAKTLKGNTEKILYQLFYQEPLSESRKVYPTENFTKNSLPLTSFEIGEILESRIDTFITFNPETYKEEFQFKKNPEIRIGDISGFQIVQQWYWDAQLQQLAVQLKRMQPQVGVKKENGKIMWQKPLYTLKFD